jgi:pimeloyl-ACP methyl ester carboxylesterase
MGARCTIAVAGAELIAETEGEGDPLVFLHGFGGDRHTWDEVASVIRKERRIVRYDLRGYGESAELANASFRHSNDLLEVMNALELHQCDLVGLSMGGAIAVNFAIDRPERVRRLVLVSPGLVGWEWSAEWRRLWTGIRDAARSGDISRARELWWNHPLFSTARAHPAAAAHLRASISQYSGKQWIRDNEAPALPDLDRLPALAVPTLLLGGTEDMPDFRAIADFIAAAVPGVSRVDMIGAGHMLHLERPVEVTNQIKKFLA